MNPSRYPRELILLLGRSDDISLSTQFGVAVARIRELREKLGIPERSGKRIDSLTFIRAWQRCTSIREVAIALGMEVNSVYSRAAFLRRKGVKLKDLSSGREEFWNLIREAADESVEKMDAEHATEVGNMPGSSHSGANGHQYFSGGPNAPEAGDRGLPSPSLPPLDPDGKGATRKRSGRNRRGAGRTQEESDQAR